MLPSSAVRIPFQIPARGPVVDVVGMGENSFDLLAVVAEYPANGTKQRLQRFAWQPGGQIATALVACAKLGWKPRYIGRFGSDEFGTRSRESLIAAGVDVSRARIVASATNQFAVVLVDARTGERTVLWDRHPGLNVELDDVVEEAVNSGRVLMVDCQEPAVAVKAARLARREGIPTLAGVEKVRPGIQNLLCHVDAIIADADFPTALTGYEELGRALEAMAREFNAPLVCVPLGADGSLARCSGWEIRTPGYSVDCVDSTGAGDVFRGAFAAGCLRAPCGDVEDVLAYANAAAALSCRALGARGALPHADDVERLIFSRPRMQPLGSAPV